MTCVRPADKTACIVAQSQGDPRTGQHRFGIALEPPRDGQAQGLSVMPFVLAIDSGVIFNLDEQTLGEGAPYSSCTGQGCRVSIRAVPDRVAIVRSSKPLFRRALLRRTGVHFVGERSSFPTLVTDTLRSAKALTVTGRTTAPTTGIAGGEAATIAVPLTGFSHAYDRAMALGN